MKHKTVKKGDAYKIEGDNISRNKKFCPKCGPGVFMADHGTRVHCGRCGYTEFNKSKIEKKSAPKQVPEPTKPLPKPTKPAPVEKKPDTEVKESAPQEKPHKK